MSAAEAPAERARPPKENPEALVLRGRPRPVIRFRRGLIVAVAAAAASALVALTWTALEPGSFTGTANELSEPGAMASPDALAEMPATYADVPQLGPPLPGDLGRAIVDRQREADRAPRRQPEGLAGPSASGQAEEVERESALASPVVVRLSRPAAERPSAPDSNEADPGSAGGVGLPGGRRPGQESVLSSDARGDGAVLRSVSPWTLAAGTVIPASLLTGLNSDLPGIVVAQVTGNVRDSATGRNVLIPQGARLVGDYDSKIAFGQQRVLLVWKRIVLPDGSSVDLGGIPATDSAGYSGLADGVDFHEWRLLKGVALSSLLGAGTELGLGGDDSDLVRAIRQSAQSNGDRAGQAIVSRNLDVQPTLTVRPGWPVRAVLRRDLVLQPWSGW